MKTAEQILQHVESIERGMLRRPQMYASSPSSLEEQLHVLASVREFILSDEDGFPRESAYREYSQRVGKVGVISFTHKCTQEIWDRFCKFFKGYLVSQGRAHERKRRPTAK